MINLLLTWPAAAEVQRFSSKYRGLRLCGALVLASCGTDGGGVLPPVDTGDDPATGSDASTRDGSAAGEGDGDGDLGDGDHARDAGGHPGDGGAPPDGPLDASTPSIDGGSGDGELDAGPQPREDGGGDAPDASTPIVADAGGPADGDEDAGVPPVDPPPSKVRFIAFGDGGTGDDAQKKVAAAIKKVCAERGCDFAIYMGDNIYETGVQGVDDAQFKSKFEEPFAELDFPFYVALGNHDYGSNGSNILPNNGQSAAQIEYTAHSEKWNLPNYYYTFTKGPIAFFVIDTNSVVLPEQLPFGGINTPPAPADEQQAWLDKEMAKSTAPWKIVFGHHPYLSNGEHGNAGDYGSGLEAKGTRLKSLFEQSVCGKAQVFMSGHDHDREWLEPACGTSFIVSGAAAKLRAMPGHDTASRWSDATKRGFLWAEVAGDTMVGVFYDEDGAENYEDSIQR